MARRPTRPGNRPVRTQETINQIDLAAIASGQIADAGMSKMTAAFSSNANGTITDLNGNTLNGSPVTP